MSDLASIARKGYEKAYSTLTPIWSVHAVNSTPVIAGGPDGNTVHMVDGQLKWWGIRPTAVRGVWRWWIRALLAGLLWEEGYTCDYRGIAKLEERLGLGTTSKASRVFLDVSYLPLEDPIKRRPYFTEIYITRRGNKRIDFAKLMLNYEGEYKKNGCKGDFLKYLYLIPRYTLWSMGKKGESRNLGNIAKIIFEKQPFPPEKVILDISICTKDKNKKDKNKDKNLEEKYGYLYMYALWLALALGGIGQATSRGFGKFSLQGPQGEKIYDLDINSIIKKLSNSIDLGSLIDSNIREKCKNNTEVQLPLIPTFHSATMKYEKLSPVKYIVIKDRRYRNTSVNDATCIWDVLIGIGQASLKVFWKLSKNMSIDSPGAKLHTWVLGLPRYIKGTGYLIGIENPYSKEYSDPGRLQSLIKFTPYLNNDGKWGSIIYMFITNDYNTLYYGGRTEKLGKIKGIYHVPRGKDKKLVREIEDKLSLEEILESAFSNAKKILEEGA